MGRAVLTERGKVEMKEMQKCFINCYISRDIQWTAARLHWRGGSRPCVSECSRACLNIGARRTQVPRSRHSHQKATFPWPAISLHQYYFNSLAMGYYIRENTSKLQCPNIKEALTHSFQWGQFADTVRPLLHRASAKVHPGSQRMVPI